MNTVEFYIDLFGWSAAIALLIAYTLVSNKKIVPNGYPYQLLNIWGSIGLALNAYYYSALPSVGLNLVWLGIGIFMIFKIWRRKFFKTETDVNEEIRENIV